MGANRGRGVDNVFDPVGGAATEPAFRSLAWNERNLIAGFANGEIPELATNLSLLKGSAIIGVDFRQSGIFEHEAARRHIEELLALYSESDVSLHMAKAYRLEEFVAAINEVRSGTTVGRVILIPYARTGNNMTDYFISQLKQAALLNKLEGSQPRANGKRRFDHPIPHQHRQF